MAATFIIYACGLLSWPPEDTDNSPVTIKTARESRKIKGKKLSFVVRFA